MNLAMLTDLYQFSMLYGYHLSGTDRKMANFDVFFRRHPFNGGFAVFAGLADLLAALQNFHFSDSDLEYIKSLGLKDAGFIEKLKNFHFSGDIFSFPEGSICFPGEPLMRFSGPLFEVQLLETLVLNIINFQTLIATKSARIFEASGKSAVVEFGLRRSHGPDGGLSASRAAYIGGCVATSNVLAGQKYGIPVKGTMAHSWIMSFPNELISFREYAKAFPDSSVFLVDTYNTLADGVPNAITVGLEMKKHGHTLKGIRLDSGDLAYLSVEARKMLDEAGLTETKILASNDLDEWIVDALRHEGAKIDIWGIGTKLVTGSPDSALGGVFKLSAIENEDGVIIPKIKVSQNEEKTTNPGLKSVYRVYDTSGMMTGDIICLADEIPTDESFKLAIHPLNEYKFFRVTPEYSIKAMMKKVFSNGVIVDGTEKLSDIRNRVLGELEKLHSSHKRLVNPHYYKVSLSQKLFRLRKSLLEKGLNIQKE
ncbi:MAG: nicotinate phosphoribosyltransferase [Candidatus Riflebacteria bacterium]|nr:nicotinate phosphoribosyltransferase [Candidatus Riflebacteria bacterium]